MPAISSTPDGRPQHDIAPIPLQSAEIYASNGYFPIPIAPGEKRPLGAGWQKRADWRDAPWNNAGGVGLRCGDGGLIGIDIDFDDAAAIEAIAFALGSPPRRRGKRGLMLMVRAVSDGAAKSRDLKYADPFENSYPVQMLGAGRQFVAFGRHPAAGVGDYAWLDGAGPANTPLASLPMFESVGDIIQTVDAAMALRGLSRPTDAIAPLVAAAKPAAPRFDDLDATLAARIEADLLRHADVEIADIASRGAGTGRGTQAFRLGAAIGAWPGLDIEALADRVEAATPDDEGNARRSFLRGADACDGVYIQALADRIRGTDQEALLKRARESGALPARSYDDAKGDAPYADPVAIPAGSFGDSDDWRAFVEPRFRTLVSPGGVSYLVTLPDGRVVRYRRQSAMEATANTFVTVGEARTPFFKWATSTLAPWQEVFKPEGCGAREYNLWRGFGYAPAPGWDKCRRLIRHVHEVICAGDPDKFHYVMRWLAWGVQNPGKPAGVALVLHSEMEGTGKSTLSTLMCEIYGENGKETGSIDALIGRFNGELETTCFLALEEATFAGNPRESARLRTILTASELMLERKGQEMFSSPNHLKVMLTTNQTWNVAAGMAARRFFVVDVNDHKARTGDWFGPMQRDLNANGSLGKRQFLGFLLRMRLGDWTPQRDFYQTEELVKQRVLSAPPVWKWLADWADNGLMAYTSPIGISTPLALGQKWKSGVLVDAFMKWAQTHARGVTDMSSCMFGKQMASAGLIKVRMNPDESGYQPWGYYIPSAERLCEALDKAARRSPREAPRRKRAAAVENHGRS